MLFIITMLMLVHFSFCQNTPELHNITIMVHYLMKMCIIGNEMCII